jgi:phytoene synthase
MKFANVALTGLVVITASSLTSQIDAFTLQSQSRGLSNVGISQSRHQHKHMSVSPMEEIEKENANASTSTATGRSRSEIENELASGRILEDGPVIDFGSIKDTTSRAERALAEARKEYISAITSGGKGAVKLGFAGDGAARLMGINDEVVQEVGREVGAFVNDNTKVQNCAAYLRAYAPKGLFEEHTDAPVMSQDEMKAMDTVDLTALLKEAYDESGLVTEAFAKTFYLGTQLLPEPAQKAIWAVYVWCRRTDEIVDAPRKPEDVNMLTDLSAWELRLENLFRYGMVEDVLDLPLLDSKIKYPNLPIEPFVDMVRGMLMDIPDLGQERYETFEELHLYCYRVAGTVGLMSMPVFGCAEGYNEVVAK